MPLQPVKALEIITSDDVVYNLGIVGTPINPMSNDGRNSNTTSSQNSAKTSGVVDSSALSNSTYKW